MIYRTKFGTLQSFIIKDWSIPQYSLTELMVSHDLPRSKLTNQIAFDEQDLHFTPEFERTMDRRC